MPPKKAVTSSKSKAASSKKPAAKKGSSKEAKPEPKPKAKKILEGITIPLKGLMAVMNTPEDSSEAELPTVNAIEGSGRWPLLIDEQERASTFLRYRNVNYLSLMNAKDMEPERIRLAILGGIRFGKPAVIDFLDVDDWPLLNSMFEKVKPGFLEEVVSKSLLKDEKFFELISEEDSDEYKNKFDYQERYQKQFRVIFLTTKEKPSNNLLENLFPVTIKV